MMRDRMILINAKEYAPVLAAALGYYLEYLTHKLNNEDLPESELFGFMDVYTTAGSLWVKALRAQGVPHEEIEAALASVDLDRLGDDGPDPADS